ncbi:GntR family transcriptional regulator, partial [Caulobacter sp. S45]|uniref:GntR family transcriptional regulator n=1 Tax=Caulobacter sp. S45 TaxID=1641861 RepID=UPI00131EA200
MRSANHDRRAQRDVRQRCGQWPPGYRVPFETELMAEYGCARMTVNKAMAALVEA